MTLKALTKRVEHWKTVLAPLGLSHYIFTVRWSETPFGSSTAAASVEVYSDYDEFDLEIRRTWVDAHTAEELDEAIIHELMHVLFRHFDRLADQMEEYVTPAAYAIWYDNYVHHTESIVRRLSTTLVTLAR